MINKQKLTSRASEKHKDNADLRMRRLLVLSTVLVSAFATSPLSASAQIVQVHRKYNPNPPNDYFYTTNINEAPNWKLDNANYFGLQQNNPGSG